MEPTNVSYREHDGIGQLTIERPKALNALNRETLSELHSHLQEIAGKNHIGVLIITGDGEKAFVAGADITQMYNLGALEAAELAQLGHAVMAAIEDLPQPVIAAVNGFALGGGCELALACDMRIAAENAKFGQPEVNLGIIPGFGGTQRLPRLVGKGIAAELIYTGDMIDAAEALRIGLVNRVVPQSELLSTCQEIGQKILAKGPVAVRICKQVINDGLQMDLARANRYEAAQFGNCFASADQKEGMQAFMEKRSPKFKR